MLKDRTQFTLPSTQHERDSAIPFVSVLIPARNEEDSIGRCIASIWATGWPVDQLEILVIDHQSIDRTAAIAHEAGARVIEASRAKKIGAVRNAGLAAAQGTFVAFVDADCTVPSTWLSSAINILVSDTRIGAVGGGPALAPVDGTWVERCLAPTRRTVELRTTATTLTTCSVVARRELLLNLGCFNENVNSGEDDDISNRMREHGLLLIAAAECQVVHHGFSRTLPQIVQKEIWHGSNHIDVRTGADITLGLTLIFLAASCSVLTCLGALLVEPRPLLLDALLGSLILQLAPPGLFALKRLKRSRWPWSLAAPMVIVGYAYFLGHAIGVLQNLGRRMVTRPS